MSEKGEVGYYQDQIKSIQQTFAKFDEGGTGRILVERVPELLKELGRDPETGVKVQQLLRERDVDNSETCTFEEAVQHLKNVELQDFPGVGGEQSVDKTVTPLTLMRRLDEYRKQCEEKGEYVEAKKARMKYEELRQKEEIRQRRLVEQAQIHEMNEVEQAQKQQFLEFSAAWDRYMADYESTAYMSVERLREQHAQDFAEFQEQLRKQPPGCKQSKELLELRRKQQALAKLGRYKEANEVKKQADDLEKWEQAKNSSEVHDRTRRQEDRLRAAQQKALAALLKRIQRDRGEQIRHRQMDSQRLIQRNKNLKADLSKKQHLEFKRADGAIRSILSQPEQAQKLLDENDPTYVARCAATGELPLWSDRGAKWKGASLPKNYRPPGDIAGGRVAPRQSAIDRQTPR